MILVYFIIHLVVYNMVKINSFTPLTIFIDAMLHLQPVGLSLASELVGAVSWSGGVK